MSNRPGNPQGDGSDPASSGGGEAAVYPSPDSPVPASAFPQAGHPKVVHSHGTVAGPHGSQPANPLSSVPASSAYDDQTLDAFLAVGHAGHGPHAHPPHRHAGGDRHGGNGGPPTAADHSGAGGDGPHDGVGEQLGPYRILAKVGEGGMGVVYKADQLAPVRREVAIKVIKVGMDTREVVVRFEAERQALALMSHPNVARVLDAGATETGRPYFVMEYVAGVPLVEFCDAQRLTVRQRLGVFCDVCHAVQHAHQKGIIHRDLKPSNILVASVDGKPVPKVIDFGIAKATAGGQSLTDRTVQTLHGTLIGTPEYASPEQAITGGLDVDTRTDVYSLGVILYQLLTGTLPLDAATLRRDGPEGIARVLREVEPPRPSTRISQIRRDAPTRAILAAARAGGAGGFADTTYLNVVIARGGDPRSYGRALKGDLDWITLTAMEKDRTRRYGTAQDLAADVERYLNDEPILARPPSNRYRVAKFVRRHRTGVAAAALCALLLAGGAFGTTIGMVRAMQAQEAERAQRVRAETALAELRAARAKQVEAAAAALRQADQLLSVSPLEAERMALPAYDRVLAGTSPDDPLALSAGDVAARTMLHNGKAAAAAELLADVAARARAAGGAPVPAAAARVAPRGRFFSDLADAVEARAQREPRKFPPIDAAAEATDLRREALATFRADPNDQSPVRLDVGERLASSLAAAGRLGEAERAYDDALDDHRRLLSDGDPRTSRLVDRLATLLFRAGRDERALDVVRRQFARQQAVGEAGGGADALVGRRVDVADALLRLGRFQEGSAEFAQALELTRRLRPGAESGNQVYWRYLTLRAGIGGEAAWKSQALRGNAWMTVDEALARGPSRDLRADEVKWSKVTFRLHRWDGNPSSSESAASTTPAGGPAAAGRRPPIALVAEGPLAVLRTLPDLPPGVYFLSFKLPRADGEKVRTTRAATWILAADWRLALYEPTLAFNPNDRAKSFWAAINVKVPAERATQRSLLLLDVANAGEREFGVRVGQGPGGRRQDWAAVADARVSLPPGLYRVAITSDDGSRLHLDDRNVIDSWRSRPLQTDADVVDLTEGMHDVRVEYYQGTGDYTLRVQFEPFDAAADALVADALGTESGEFRRWAVRRGQWLERVGQAPDAIDGYAKAVASGLRLGNSEQDQHLQAVRGLVRSMTAAGKGPEAPAALEAAVADVYRDRRPEGDATADTLLAAARGRAAAGQADAAAALADRALDAAAQNPGLNDPRGRRVARRAVLSKLGAASAANDGKLPSQLWSALDEAMLEDTDLIPLLRSANPGDVGWTLVRWDPSAGNPTVAQGTLARPAADGPLKPGAYLVQFRLRGAAAFGRALPTGRGFAAGGRDAEDLGDARSAAAVVPATRPATAATQPATQPTAAAAEPAAASTQPSAATTRPAEPPTSEPSGPPARAALAGPTGPALPPAAAGEVRFCQWLLLANVESAVYLPDGEGALDRFAWNLLTTPIKAVARPALGGLASLDALAAEPAPDGPTHRFAFRAEARLPLPPGRYRVLATASDGVRVTVGDRRLIYAWPSRQASRMEFADVDLFDGPNPTPLEVDHFRANAEEKLFVRFRPLDPAADALAASLGCRPRPLAACVEDQSEAIRDDAYQAAAWAARGVLRARSDKPDVAVKDFVVAMGSDGFEPLFGQLRMVGHLLRADDGAHRRAVAEFLPNPARFPGKDRGAAGRSAVAVLLADRRPDVDVEARMVPMLSQATAPSVLGPPPPVSLFARALLAQRQGNAEQALQRLDQAADAKTGAPGHPVLCGLLRAVVLKGKRDDAGARKAYADALEAMSKWEHGPLDRWDAYDTFDWMAAQVLKRQAAKALGKP